ncbi:D-site 20S pre-rRNA nuclease [Xylariaceae sp. FL0255]|nr:D-site 20S pre-rRNA nuclease [Xylariaceae sp. FL0255]
MEAVDSPKPATDNVEPSLSTEGSDSASGAPATTPTEPMRPIHSLVLDANPLINNDPPVSSLLATAHELYTIPSVISEIRDAATRTRVETTLLPFLQLRNPKPESVKFVQDFARRTGDLEILSKPDIHLMALTYELECERNGGDWRLRNMPGQKSVNGKSPAQIEREKQGGVEVKEGDESVEEAEAGPTGAHETIPASEETTAAESSASVPAVSEIRPTALDEPVVLQESVTKALDSLSLEPSETPSAADTVEESTDATPTTNPETTEVPQDEEDGDDDKGWITPSNLKKHQAKDKLIAPEQPTQRVLQAAILTSDYAMQNVLLRMNINLVSSGLSRITRVKTWVLRCHGCFQITRDTSKQFCPKCGQATLTRVSCSTDQATGQFTIHLKKNFQWNNRGNVYSVPKPVHGSASGKVRKGERGGDGGGKNGWGRELIFAEDQKEFVRGTKEREREGRKARDVMDEEYLPGILTGHRTGGGGGKIKVGAGRNVNSRKRF